MANLGETRSDYWTAIRRAAEDVAETTRNPFDADGGYDDDAQQERSEALDGWAESFTIYNSDSVAVLRWTENDDAVFEEGVYSVDDIGAGVSSVYEIYGRIAYYAVRADIARLVDAIESTAAAKAASAS